MKLRLPMRVILLACTACLILGTPKAAVACDVRVSLAESAQLSPARGFGLPSSPTLVNPLRIELLGRQTGCSVIIGFASRSGNPGDRHMTSGVERINYRLLSRPNGSQELADLPAAQDDALLRGTVNAQHTTSFQYYLVVPGNQTASPGSYRDQIDISVYSESNGFPQLVTSHTIDVALTVKSEINLQILSGRGSGSGVHTVDFGELQTGEQLELRIKVNSNTGFVVSVSSENGGKFRHVSQPQASIPYTVQLGASTATDWRRPISSYGLPASGSRVSFLPLTITVGSVEYSLAGLYRDRLLVTVQAQ